MGRDTLPSQASQLFASNPKGGDLRYNEGTTARTLANGYFRGWGLQYGELSELIENDPLFRAARQIAYEHQTVFSILPELRLKNIYWIILKELQYLGSFNVAEFGVYRGGTSVFLAYLLRELSPGALLYGFDTFKGAPETRDDGDLHRPGDFADTSLKAIERRMNDLGLTNFRPIVGDFCLNEVKDTFGDEELALAHTVPIIRVKYAPP